MYKIKRQINKIEINEKRRKSSLLQFSYHVSRYAAIVVLSITE